MRKITTFTALALLLASPVAALAADVTPSTKDKPTAVVTPDWDIAFGGGIASDYIFRGISQSNRWPSPTAYTEFRYNVRPNLQLYGAISAEGIDYPNRAASEVDFYGGIRPTFDKLALDFGAWYYWYPGGRLFNGQPGGPLGSPSTSCTNGFYGAAGSCNIYEADLSFWEVYAKGTYTFNDTFSLTGDAFYSPSWLNTGADGTYASVIAKAVIPSAWLAWLPNKDIGAFVSGEFGHYWYGTTGPFYGNSTYPGGIPLPDYNTWNVGLAFTWKVFTLDLRYYDTDLSKSNCDVLTSDHTATFNASNITAINPSGLGSNWCGSAFVAKLSFDLTVNTNLK